MEELFQRGLVRQTTNEAFLRSATNPVTFYVGFDPTASSLHVGHLLQIVTIQRLARMGHKPIVLIGDATARIGDPTGKRSARPMLAPEDIEANAKAIEAQIRALVPNATFVRNSAWYDDYRFTNFLQDIGSCFSVNVMLRAECFKARLEDGLSFLELSYMLMQAFDFLHLHLRHGCTLQVGGDDQWSNILAGVDLIRRKTSNEAYGLTLPLLVNSDGTKMGKTEQGTVWLSPERTPIFDFFQFWRNIPDDKVLDCYKYLTFLPVDVNGLDGVPLFDKSQPPHLVNTTKKMLAHVVTNIVHGQEAATEVLARAEGLFERRDTSAAEAIEVRGSVEILEALKLCGMAKSRTEARNLILNHGVFIDDVEVKDAMLHIERSCVLRKGKKMFKRLEVIP